ncbi:WYL domain-containing protein [Patescibacteria group bacterium]|nr:WYL domain-containing protein [Patescibacteria group bacterium]MCG2702298.1 WYL domain-containing protein [Candidatus Parcubacteria bacterium]MBU4264577.1 WYL domain-containing protein [Patescibacteria group bacterium]MBU4390245.1 WYL domain-containing protein [Patescibacteria group bacterium]MBU4397312.1 WYL domain-containing protein [Patescibacteria group bacterium]
MKWSKTMYRYFAFRILDEVFGNSDSWNNEEAQIIKNVVKKYQSRLNRNQINLIKFRVRKTKSNYKANLLNTFENMYWKEIDRGDTLYPPVEFDNKTYELWTKAVRLRKSVKMLYESTTSGMTTRIVDPYKTETPYGRGFCHTRKETRKFRFDRIIEISLTDNKFIKPKNWDKNK